MAETLTIVEEHARVMGSACSLHLAVPEGERPLAEAALRDGFAHLRAVEACLTRFSEASELSALNRSAGAWFTASATLFAVTEAALEAARMTEGLFDPTLLGHLRALGYDRDYRALAEAGAPEPSAPATPPTGGWRAVQTDPARRRIRLPTGVGLDFGGIGKGWAADDLLAWCFTDFPHVLIALGGDLRVRGGPLAGALWSVGVYDPARSVPGGADAHLAILTLGTGGVATSGGTEHQWRQGPLVRHHLLDPRTGFPAQVWLGPASPGDAPATATALAPTAALAEVAAKVALLRNDPAPLPALAGTAAIVVRGDGTPLGAPQIENYVREQGGQVWWLR